MNNLDPKKRSNLIPRGEKGKCRWCMKPVPKGRRSWCSDACVDDALIRTQPAHARRKVGERDKGVCACCGLDTNALENTIRRLRTIAMSGLDGYDRTSNRASKRYHVTRDRLFKIVSAARTDFEAAQEEARQLANPSPFPDRRQSPWSGWNKPLAVTVPEQRIRLVNRRLKGLAAARLAALVVAMLKKGFDGVSVRGGVSRSLWDADHILPVVKGGGGCGLENYRTLCQPCHKDATRALAAQRALERRGIDPQQTLF